MIPGAQLPGLLGWVAISASHGFVMAWDLQRADVKLRLKQSLADLRQQLAECPPKQRDRRLLLREFLIAVFGMAMFTRSA